MKEQTFENILGAVVWRLAWVSRENGETQDGLVREDQSTVVVEIDIIKQWDKPVIDPLARKLNGGITDIVDHVGRHKHPLREG